MARRTFNPDDAIGGLFEQPPEEQPQDTPLTPTELNTRVKDVLERGLPTSLELVGELSNLKRQGHWYFAIKDESSVVSCVLWRSDAARVRFDPSDGDEVVVTGRISHWVPGGRTQFYATSMKKKGLGSLEEQFQALCTELRREGYFDEAHKKRLPSFPRRVAVVTSATGAAVADVKRTALGRLASVELLVVDVRVQGDGAAEQVARAISRLDAAADSLGLDAIIVTRGGGSREDLWAFNERVVADAAFRCRTPLVAAIGHEVDTSVIELIADHRASTPTQAAMHLIPDARELAGQVAYNRDRLSSGLARRMQLLGDQLDRLPRELTRVAGARLDRMRARLAELGGELVAQRPTARLAAGRARLESLVERLRGSMKVKEQSSKVRLQSLSQRLEGIGPQSVLHRGYAYTLDDKGQVVRSIEGFAAGDRFTAVLADGRLHGEVTSVSPDSDLDEEGSER